MLSRSRAAGAAIGLGDGLSIFVFYMQFFCHLCQFLIKCPNWNARQYSGRGKLSISITDTFSHQSVIFNKG